MRKSLVKSLVAAAVVGTTMALTSVAAMASDSLDVTNVVDNAVVYDLFGQGSATSVAAVVGSGSATVASAGDGAALNDDYSFTTTGLTFMKSKEKGVKLNANNNSDFSSKNYVSVPVAAGDTVYVYASSNTSAAATVGVYASTDHKSTALGKSVVAAKDAEGTAGVDEVKIDIPATFTGSAVYIVSEKGDYALDGAVANASYYGVAVVSEEEGDEPVAETFLAGTVDTKPAIVVAEGRYYAVLPISKAKAEDSVSLKVAGVEAEAIYSAVSIPTSNYSAAADFGGDYVYGIILNVNDLTKSLADIQAKVTVAFS